MNQGKATQTPLMFLPAPFIPLWKGEIEMSFISFTVICQLMTISFSSGDCCNRNQKHTFYTGEF